AMGQVEVDEFLPGVEIGVLNRDVEIAAPDIVDQDVDRPRFGEHAVAQVFAYRGLCDVAGKRRDLPPALAYFGRGLSQCVGVTGVEDDVGARFRQGECYGAAEAAAAAGNESALSDQAEFIKHGHAYTPARYLGTIILSDNLASPPCRGCKGRT